MDNIQKINLLTVPYTSKKIEKFTRGLQKTEVKLTNW